LSDYQSVQKALAEGSPPSMLCATCPWDRSCLSPPTMTKAEIDAEIAKAQAQDAERAAAARRKGKTLAALDAAGGVLMATVVYAGKDTSAAICPVLALRLRSSGGREIADGLKVSMQGWDDSR
jgi:hypothetical protein